MKNHQDTKLQGLVDLLELLLAAQRQNYDLDKVISEIRGVIRLRREKGCGQ